MPETKELINDDDEITVCDGEDFEDDEDEITAAKGLLDEIIEETENDGSEEKAINPATQKA